jgi:hypothetical protein
VTRRVAALPKTWRFPSSENARSYSRWPAVNVSRRDNGHFIVPRSGPADERDQAEPPTRPAGRRASSVEYHDGPDPGPAATWISKDSAGDVNSPQTPIMPAGSAAAMAKRSAGAEALLAAASPHPPPDARVGPSERRWRDTAEHPRRGLGCGLSPSSGRGAIAQEAIDIWAVLNALRVLPPGVTLTDTGGPMWWNRQRRRRGEHRGGRADGRPDSGARSQPWPHPG